MPRGSREAYMSSSSLVLEHIHISILNYAFQECLQWVPGMSGSTSLEKITLVVRETGVSIKDLPLNPPIRINIP